MKSKNKNTIVILRGGMHGGTGTLSIRIAEWAALNSFEVYFLCYRIDNMENMESLKKSKVIVVCLDDIFFMRQFKTIWSNNANYIFITYTLQEYAAANRIKNNFENVKRVIFYNVNSAFYRTDKRGEKNSMRKLLIRFVFSQAMKKVISRKEIIFMDEECKKDVMDGLKLNLVESSINKIVRLPMRINDTDENVLSVHRHNPISIGTMTRLDLPFKGYIIGLIRWVLEEGAKHNLNLIIAADLSESEEVSSLLKTLPINMLRNIDVIGGLPYEKIPQFFDRIDLFIGMGTSVLDAVNYGVPSFIVDSYTRELKISGDFVSNPEYLADGPVQLSLDQIIERFSVMSSGEYNDIIRRQRNNLRKMYDLETNMEALLGGFPNITKRRQDMLPDVFLNFIMLLTRMRSTRKIKSSSNKPNFKLCNL